MALILLSFLDGNSQTTLVLQPGDSLGKDALLHGLSSQINNNYGSNGQLAASAWTFSGIPGVVRSVLEFDLSSVPNGATIDSAFLSLYAWDSNAGLGQHSTLSGSNECWIQRITSSWDESTVTWNDQPTTTIINQVAMAASTIPTQDYLDIDVTNLVQDMLDNPSSSFGFLIRLQNESYHRQMNFASSDHDKRTLHPKLVVNYTAATSTPEIINSDLEFSVFPNPASNSISIILNKNLQKAFQLQITSLSGQIVYEADFHSSASIDVSNYSIGAYFVEIYSDDFTFTKKLIIE